MRVHVIAPYGRNEVTAAAIRLADVGLELGHEVTYVPSSVREQVVHPLWDSRVGRPVSREYLKTAAGSPDVCVWFDHNIALMKDYAAIITKPTRQVTVVLPHSITKTQLESLSLFDTVVCPSRSSREVLASRPECKGANLASCVWDAGVEPRTRREPARRPQTVVVTADASAIDDVGAQTLYLCRGLLSTYPESSITLCCAKTWDKRNRRILRDMVTGSGHRLAVVYQRAWPEQLALFATHEWVVIASPRADFGLNAARAMACGAPAVCYDVAPFSEYVAHGRNGLIVDCELAGNWLGITYAAPSTANMSNALVRAMRPETLESMRSQEWGLSKLRREFTKFWATVLD